MTKSLMNKWCAHLYGAYPCWCCSPVRASYFTVRTGLFGALYRPVAAQDAALLLFRCGAAHQLETRLPLCDHVHRAGRDGRYGQYRGRGHRPDHWRAGAVFWMWVSAFFSA